MVPSPPPLPPLSRVRKLNENGQNYGYRAVSHPVSQWSDMDLSYLKNYIYEAPRETFEPSYQEKSDIYKPKGNKVYEHIKKEIDSRSKKVKSSDKNSNTYQVNSIVTRSLYNIITEQGLFVDANRNAAVVIGDRDIKNDVQDKKRREK